MLPDASAFLQSAGIILREGFEVVLLIGAMLAVLRKTGAGDRVRSLWWGAGLALVASLATAAGVEALLGSGEELELMEGFTLLLAAAVLLFVGHWLLAKADVARWKAYLERRLRGATARGSLLALGLVAFLAVFREGVETVLFYRALVVSEPSAGAAILGGFATGLVLLLLLGTGIVRFGARVPLRPFFAVTSAFLLLLSFTFAGKGVHELQEARLVSETGLLMAGFPPLGVYPTLETVAGQVAIVLAVLAPVLYRRRRGAVAGPARRREPGGGRDAAALGSGRSGRRERVPDSPG